MSSIDDLEKENEDWEEEDENGGEEEGEEDW